MYTNREYHYTLCLYSSLATVSQCLNPNWIAAGNLSFAVRQHRKRTRRYFQGVHWFVPTEFQQEQSFPLGPRRAWLETSKGVTAGSSPHNTHTQRAAEIKGILVLIRTKSEQIILVKSLSKESAQGNIWDRARKQTCSPQPWNKTLFTRSSPFILLYIFLTRLLFS